jgi:hypothetical protein
MLGIGRPRTAMFEQYQYRKSTGFEDELQPHRNPEFQRSQP